MTGPRVLFVALTLALCALLAACGGGPPAPTSTPTAPGTSTTSPASPATPGGAPPAITPGQAAQVIERYAAAGGGADPSAAALEAGAAKQVGTRLRAIDPRAAAITLGSGLAIPRVAGYPKWFVAGAVDKGATGDAALFTQTRAGAPWVLRQVVRITRPMPELRRDAQGYAVAARPGATAKRQAAALLSAVTTGRTGDDPLARALWAGRRLFTGAGWTAEQQAAPYGGSYALRSADGGAVVWYVLRYDFTAVNAGGRYEITLTDEAARLLGASSVRRRLGWRALYQSAAYTPPATATPAAPAAGERVLGVSLPGWVRVTGG